MPCKAVRTASTTCGRTIAVINLMRSSGFRDRGRRRRRRRRRRSQPSTGGVVGGFGVQDLIEPHPLGFGIHAQPDRAVYERGEQKGRGEGEGGGRHHAERLLPELPEPT